MIRYLTLKSQGSAYKGGREVKESSHIKVQRILKPTTYSWWRKTIQNKGMLRPSTDWWSIEFILILITYEKGNQSQRDLQLSAHRFHQWIKIRPWMVIFLCGYLQAWASEFNFHQWRPRVEVAFLLFLLFAIIERKDKRRIPNSFTRGKTEKVNSTHEVQSNMRRREAKGIYII